MRCEPSRIWSIVVTVYGDAIVPRGGSVWLGTLARFFETLGVGEGAVRTAMSRLAADGWLVRNRVGRNSFYRLAEKGRDTFAAATEHIYNPPALPWSGAFDLAILPQNGEREAARTALQEAGFGSPSPGLWIAPQGAALPTGAADAVLRLAASTDRETAARLAASAWPLARTADGYARFQALFGPLADSLRGGLALSEADSFAARILLIHAYRRVILRDPILPAALLPPDWPGADARRLCGTIYRAVLGPSEAWLDENGLCETGKLPAPCPSLFRRFRQVAEKRYETS
nr:phenylacetic acid degradation operon negative regulatory protein PaaX [Enterovirga sp. DB1703]